MAAHHPLGWARPPGGQMRYWIRSGRRGVLGGVGFGSATFQLRARDEWIGWTAGQRAANIGRVVCNHRFLILPGVKVHGLASKALRLAAARLADDWESRYSVRPAAAYTHVGPDQDGYCYHRAGWSVARADRRPPGQVRHGAGAGAGEELAPQALPEPAAPGRLAGRRIRRRRGSGLGGPGVRTLGPHRRAGASAHRLHGPRLAGEHGRGSAGDLSGGGGAEGRLPPAVEPEGDHGPHSGAAFRGDRRPLPGREGNSCHPGRDDAELHRPGGDGRPGRDRRRRQGQRRDSCPCRAGGDGRGPAAGPLCDGRRLPRGRGGGQPAAGCGCWGVRASWRRRARGPG